MLYANLLDIYCTCVCVPCCVLHCYAVKHLLDTGGDLTAPELCSSSRKRPQTTSHWFSNYMFNNSPWCLTCQVFFLTAARPSCEIPLLVSIMVQVLCSHSVLWSAEIYLIKLQMNTHFLQTENTQSLRQSLSWQSWLSCPQTKGRAAKNLNEPLCHTAYVLCWPFLGNKHLPVTLILLFWFWVYCRKSRIVET